MPNEPLIIDESAERPEPKRGQGIPRWATPSIVRAIDGAVQELLLSKATAVSRFTCAYCGLRRYHLPGQHDQSTHGLWASGVGSGEALRREVDFRLNKAAEEEPMITTSVVAAVRVAGGQMRGTEFKLKSRESLERKIRSLVRVSGKSATVVSLTINDAVRYTAEFPRRNYVSGARSMLISMAQAGNRVEVAKNYWRVGGDFNGITAVMRSPGGQRFEVQFHTPESLATKNRIHSLYEEFRAAKDSRRAKSLVSRMRAAWRSVRRPVGALALGALTSTGV